MALAGGKPINGCHGGLSQLAPASPSVRECTGTRRVGGTSGAHRGMSNSWQESKSGGVSKVLHTRTRGAVASHSVFDKGTNTK